MADTVAAPGSLGDFFAKKKKKIKGSNLNAEAKPTDLQLKAAKDAAEDNEEDHVEKVQVVGKLTREDEKKGEDQPSAPAWRTKHTQPQKDLDDKRYPTLKKAVGQSSNINIDDGSNAQINIKTSKNLFQALDNDDSDDEDGGGGKRPQEIRAFQVTKQKGEMLSTVIQKEVDKYGGQKSAAAAAPEKKKKKKKAKNVESSEEELSEDEEEKEVREKKEAKAAKELAKAEHEPEEDEKIQPDLKESRSKYQGREKLPAKSLPESELEAEKENKPRNSQTGAGGGGKKGKKMAMWVEEDTKSKLMAAPEDW